MAKIVKIKEVTKSKGDRLKRQAVIMKDIFVNGFKAQLQDESTWALGVSIGLVQGLKYKGDVKRGIIAGVVTMTVVSGANGVRNVIKDMEYIKSVK